MFRRSPPLASFAIVALVAAAGCISSAPTTTNRVLSVDKALDLETADPHRQLSVTGAMIAKALCDGLPSVAISYTSPRRWSMADRTASLMRPRPAPGFTCSSRSARSQTSSSSPTSSTTADAVTRRQLLQQLQGQLNQDGPFFPLLEPGRVMVTTADIAAIDYNPTWSLDLASVTG